MCSEGIYTQEHSYTCLRAQIYLWAHLLVGRHCPSQAHTLGCRDWVTPWVHVHGHAKTHSGHSFPHNLVPQGSWYHVHVLTVCLSPSPHICETLPHQVPKAPRCSQYEI